MYLLLYSTDCIGTLHKAAEPLLWDVPNTKKPGADAPGVGNRDHSTTASSCVKLARECSFT